MSTQTNVTIKGVMNGGLVDKFGVWIGQKEWDEVLEWSEETIELFSYYQDRKTKICEEDESELKLRYDYAIAIRLLSQYYANRKIKFPEFWMVNPEPAKYCSANQDKEIRKGCASYSELLVFLVLGIARNLWPATDALNNVVSECRCSKFYSDK